MKRGILASRPRFLTASLLPVLLGTGWGYRQSGNLDWTIFLLALGATALVHAASNVWNDVGDDINGSDSINDDRIYPYTGGSRFIQNGVLDKDAMLRLSQRLALAALIFGITLIWLRGITVLWLGLTGVALGYLYSSPAGGLSRRGIGEATVALAFGVLPVCGAAWLQSGVFTWSGLLLAIPVSCWVAAILLINEVPDAVADGKVGKRTLAVRLDIGGTAILYGVLHFVALFAVLGLILLKILPIPVAVVPTLLVIVGWIAARKIQTGNRLELKQGIEMTLGVHAIGCLWLTGWAWFYPL